MNKEKKANLLIHESSPYLLQHAYNPVEWRPWNDESIALAKESNKPLLISIGYSACHWCHVMERESFEDSLVAAVMNENFVCIKVDREERPDIDHLYMDAVQIMSGRGGWPLNCFALPDGKPFYGGTYFPKEQWMNVLDQLTELYKNEPEKVIEYAHKLSEGLQQNNLIEKPEIPAKFKDDSLHLALSKWKESFDMEFGGNNYAPKFPMPNNYELMLHYLQFNEDPSLEKHLETTLKWMAYGGIYDQIGGGFARYSTDMEWKVPHFEKMLYDNAQLISLYANAYKKYKNPLYKKVVQETIEFLKNEMLDESGAFYSALDADSEGIEGKFYVWSLEELEMSLTEEEFLLLKAYYEINQKGEWEENYILLRSKSEDEVIVELGITKEELEKNIESLRSKLLSIRNKRIRPGLDDKSLTSWNALAIIGLLDAYEALGRDEYLKLALNTANFIIQDQMQDGGQLLHTYKAQKSTINGFLEDYAFSIEAFIKLYENTFDPKWLTVAQEMVDYTFVHFYDENSSFFFFNSDEDPQLASRKIEKNDNVIPASNSSLGKSLHKLGLLIENDRYREVSDQMLSNSLSDINRYIPYASNWAQQLLIRSKRFQEIAIVGEKATEIGSELSRSYLPNSICLGETTELNSLSLLENKWVEGKTMIYVCENKSCKLPVEKVEEAMDQINQ